MKIKLRDDDKRLKTWVKYTITTIIATLMMIAIFASRGGFSAEGDAATLIMAFADSFFVSGILVLGVGLLVFTASEGAFDGLGYGLQSVLRHLWFTKGKVESFYDYKMARKERRVKTTFGHLLVIGALYTAIGLIFTYVFMKNGY